MYDKTSTFWIIFWVFTLPMIFVIIMTMIDTKRGKKRDREE